MTSKESGLGHAAPMQGGGFYNQHAQLQACGGAIGLGLLSQAVDALQSLEPPLTIADFGCAQGRNSLSPLRIAIERLRERADSEIPISVVHTDQPENDFTSLFVLLRDSQESYLNLDHPIFASAIGRSFYEQILPSASVTLGWSSFAAHWLSANPVPEPGHIWTRLTPPGVRAHFAQQAASDWRTFLSRRACELRTGGRLVVVQPALEEAETTSFSVLMGWAQAELELLTETGFLQPAELSRMVILQYERHPSEVRAPFGDGAFAGLVVEAENLSRLPDPFWTAYQANGDRDALAERYVRFFQAPFQPSLFAALDESRSPEFRQEFAARLEAALRQRIVAEPRCLLTPLMVHAILVTKR
ncbi:hypothetical protein [Methylobacterium nigriterrae]|uniref:hypothetical protein n=1 Tax=Methylobacterium nigriterrae TaxID=3127512 RepID=UPI003013A184